MDIVEFAERVLGLKLLEYQKKYLTELYDIYKNDPGSFDKFIYYHYLCRRESLANMCSLFMPIFSLFSLFNKLTSMQKDDRG